MHKVTRLLADQEHWHHQFYDVRWEDMPSDPHIPMIPGLEPRPTFLVAHLFSGRRRHSDLHEHLAVWAMPNNITITILSLDTRR